MYTCGQGHVSKSIVDRSTRVAAYDIIVNLDVDGVVLDDGIPHAGIIVPLTLAWLHNSVMWLPPGDQVIEVCEVLLYVSMDHEPDLIEEAAMFGKVLLQVTVEKIHGPLTAIEDQCLYGNAFRLLPPPSRRKALELQGRLVYLGYVGSISTDGPCGTLSRNAFRCVFYAGTGQVWKGLFYPVDDLVGSYIDLAICHK